MKITDYVHLLIKEHIKYDSNVIDATCGNGFDTCFLAELVPNGHVFAYDIQDVAIKKTKERCKNFNNITYCHASFTSIHPENVDLIIFNLGYLPNGDKTITTMADDTIDAINNLISSFSNNPNLLIIITIYPGHPEGQKESEAIKHHLKDLDAKDYLVMQIKPFNQSNAPYIMTIQKKRS